MFYKFNRSHSNIITIRSCDQEGFITSIGTKGIHFGIDGTKGLFLTLFVGSFFIPISKDGISYIIRKKYDWDCWLPLYIIAVRLLAILDGLLYLLVSPFAFMIYALIFLFSLLIAIIMSPFLFCINKFNFEIFVTSMYKLAFECFLSALVIITIFLLIPLEIVAPELVICLFKINTLGVLLEYCY